jgi:4'-phosphopantetheinyl transferase
MIAASDWSSARAVVLGPRSVHVWRVHLDAGDPDALVRLLSAEEQDRARRFMFDRDRIAYIIAHGMLRKILARYLGADAESLVFVAGEFGKPALAGELATVEFNLSHSGTLALIAIARGAPVGVDVERWDRDIEHLDLAEHFFSPAERSALRALGDERQRTTEGFFNAWTRKEAYLKATGHGITRGLHHFDVTLAPGEPATLLADRLDPSATERWRLVEIAPGAGYAGALVAARDADEIVFFEGDSL